MPATFPFLLLMLILTSKVEASDMETYYFTKEFLDLSLSNVSVLSQQTHGHIFQCSLSCYQLTDCTGFIYHGNQADGCHLFKGEFMKSPGNNLIWG